MRGFGVVFTVIGGGTPKASDKSNFEEPTQGVAWLTPADLSKYKNKFISNGARDISLKGLHSSSAKLMPKGSVLFSSRAPIGYVAIAKNEISTNQGFKSFVFSKHISPSYAYYYLKSIRGLAESRGTGTTFKELSGAVAKKLPFKLAPLNEQIRIANKLDSLLAKVEAAQTRLDKIPTLLKRFRQSVLAAATSGELTMQWREKQNNHFKWQEYRFESLLEELRNGLSPKPNEIGIGYPILRISSVRLGIVEQTDVRFLECEDSIKDKYALKTNDLLFTRYNGSLDFVGVCGLVRNLKHKVLLYPDKLIRARLNHIAMPEYIEIYFSSPIARRNIIDCIKTTSGQKGISGKDIKGQKVNAPPIEEQKEIARRVESLFTLADSVEKQYQQARLRTDKLTQSLLAKAFRGELVPQDPNDEPAEKLLARIQVEKEKLKPKKTRKKAR